LSVSVTGISRNKENILIVDDEKYICTAISRWLEPEGYNCSIALCAEDAIEQLDNKSFELLISDITMPGKSGIELLDICKSRFPDMAVLMATAIDNREIAVRALEKGSYGYLIKPFEKNEFIINVINSIERRRLDLIKKDYEHQLEKEVQERTAEIRNREEEIVMRLIWASEYRDDDTGDHIRRIGIFAEEIAKELGWPQSDIDTIRLAAPMHDVGKIGVSDSILRKPGKLTEEEFGEIKKHAEIGAGILGESNIPLLRAAKEIALSHHERWDGSGYPGGLKGEEIPVTARIVAIVDVYDALVYDRVYRPAFSEEEALIIMKKGAGTHFDPEIFAVFLKLLPVFYKMRNEIDGK
jgi:putative two-component system response regulator